MYNPEIDFFNGIILFLKCGDIEDDYEQHGFDLMLFIVRSGGHVHTQMFGNDPKKLSLGCL